MRRQSQSNFLSLYTYFKHEALKQRPALSPEGGGRCFLRQFFLAIVVCFMSDEVLAEGRCPSGMFETGSRDYLACAPIPGYGQGDSDTGQDSQPPIPTIWETRWGAIVTESKGGGFGAVNGFKSEVAASGAALEQCQGTATVSKTKCVVRAVYHNQCAAYAWGAGVSVASNAIDIPTATKNALQSCGDACKIYYSGCSYAEAVPK